MGVEYGDGGEVRQWTYRALPWGLHIGAARLGGAFYVMDGVDGLDGGNMNIECRTEK